MIIKLLQDQEVLGALKILNARMDLLCPQEKVNKMPEIPESGYVNAQTKRMHGEFAIIVVALPNKEFKGKNGTYFKAQVEVEFVKDKVHKVWTPDNTSLKKFVSEKGSNTDKWMGLGVRYRDVLLSNGSESVIGEPVSVDVILGAQAPVSVYEGLL